MAVRRHHPYGTWHGEHLAPDCLLVIEKTVHDDEHGVRRCLGLDKGARVHDHLELVELQLRRRAVFGAKTLAPLMPTENLRIFVYEDAVHLRELADDIAAWTRGERS